MPCKALLFRKPTRLLTGWPKDRKDVTHAALSAANCGWQGPRTVGTIMTTVIITTAVLTTRFITGIITTITIPIIITIIPGTITIDPGTAITAEIGYHGWLPQPLLPLLAG